MNQKNNDLINSLVKDNKNTTSLSMRLHSLILFCAIFILSSLFINQAGFRIDLFEKLSRPSFLISSFLVISIPFLISGLYIRFSRFDISNASLKVRLIAPIAMIAYVFINSVFSTNVEHSLSLLQCTLVGVLISVLSLIFLLPLATKVADVNLKMQAFLIGSISLFGGLMGTHFHCPNDNMLHKVFDHGLFSAFAMTLPIILIHRFLKKYHQKKLYKQLKDLK